MTLKKKLDLIRGLLIEAACACDGTECSDTLEVLRSMLGEDAEELSEDQRVTIGFAPAS